MNRWCATILSAALALNGCATLKQTGELRPSPAAKTVPARLGIHHDGKALAMAFADPDRGRVGAAPGQFFSDVLLLPPETRYVAPQDVLEQLGTDLILSVRVADSSAKAAINPIFFMAMPLAFFLVFTPMVTVTATVELDASLRDAHSGRLLWAATRPSVATQRSQGVNPGAVVGEVTQRAVRNGVAGVLEEAARQAADYRPGAEGAQAAAARPPLPRRRLAPKAPDKRRYAIVIGIDRYREQLPKADFASDDAKAVAEFLVRRAGYPEENVILRTNEQATRSDLEKFFGPWLANNLNAESSLLVYFSGHGSPQPSTGDAYLVPYDGDPAYLEQTGYPLPRLYEKLDASPAKRVVVLLDSCFSGGGARSVLPKGAKPLVTSVKNLAAGRKVVVMSATSGNHISLAYQEGKRGLFTYFALEGLSGEAETNGDGVIDAREAFNYLKPQVERIARRVYNTEQVPQLLIPPGLLAEAPPPLN